MVVDKVNVEPQRMYSVKEVAAFLEVSENTVRRSIDNGDLAGIQVGSVWRIEGSELLDMKKRAKLSAAAKRRERAAKIKSVENKKVAAQMLALIAQRYPDLIQNLVSQQSRAPQQSTQGRRPMRRRPGEAIRRLKSSD
jgi:excisionase family DNA binding protein